MRQVIISAEINTGDSVEDLEELERKVDDLGEATEDTGKKTVDLGAKFEDVYGELQPLSGRINELEDRLHEMALAGEQNTEEFKTLQAEVIKYKKVIIDTNKAIDSFTTKGKGIQASLELGGTVVAGYSAFQSVTAMLGVENEKLLETITKLQAAQGLLASIEQIRLSLEKESILVTQGQIAATKILTAVQKAFNLVMSINPIFLIASVLIGVIAAFQDWGKVLKFLETPLNVIRQALSEILEIGYKVADFMLGGLLTAYSAQKKAAEELARTEKERTDALNKASNKRVQQLMSELKSLDEYKKKSEERFNAEIKAIDFEISKRQAAGQETAKLEAQKLKMVIERSREELKIEQDKNERLKQYLEDQAKLYGVTQETIIAQLKKSGVDVDNIRNGRLKAEKEAQDKLTEAEQKLTVFTIAENKKRAEAAKAAAERRLEEQRALEDLVVSNIRNATERQLAEISLRHDRERDELVKKYGEDTELLKELEKKQSYELDDFIAAFNKEQNDKKLERERREMQAAAEVRVMQARENFEAEIKAERALAKLKRDLALKDEKLTNSERLKIQEEFKIKSEELDKKLLENKKAEREKINAALISVEESTFSALNSIGELAIKNDEKRAKFNAIVTAAQLALDTAKAISATIAGAASAAAAGGPAAPFLLAGYIASGIATVLANMAAAVAAFKSAKVGSAPSLPDSSSGSSGSYGLSRGGQEQGFQGGQTTLTSGLLNRNEQTKSLKVTLVESDVTDIQERVATAEALRTV